MLQRPHTQYAISTNEITKGESEGRSLREEIAGQKLDTVHLYDAHFRIAFSAADRQHAQQIVNAMAAALRGVDAPADLHLIQLSLLGNTEMAPLEAARITKQIEHSQRTMRRAAARRRKK